MNLRIARQLARLAGDIAEMGPSTSFHGSLNNLTEFSQITEENAAEIGRMLLPYLYKHAPDYGLNHHDAQDAMQKINLWIVRKLREGFFLDKRNDKRKSLGNYFFRIAERALMYLYGRKVNRHETTQDVQNYVDKKEDEDMRGRELEDAVEYALRKLYQTHPDQALILFYMYRYGYKPSEMARFFPHLPAVRIKTYASEARKMVIAILMAGGITYNTKKHRRIGGLADEAGGQDGYGWLDEILKNPETWAWYTPPEPPAEA